MSFHVPNKHRLHITRNPVLGSTDEAGNNGFFVIPHPRISGYVVNVQASDGLGWEHCSVSILGEGKAKRCPTWEEMCFVKDLFWDDTDCVIQFHPTKAEYVNCHPFVLHLWRPTDQEIPTPMSFMVGPKQYPAEK